MRCRIVVHPAFAPPVPHAPASARILRPSCHRMGAARSGVAVLRPCKPAGVSVCAKGHPERHL